MPLQLLKVNAEIDEYSKNPHHLLLEAVHSTGYSGAYANPLMASETAVSSLNGSILEDFVNVSLGHCSNLIFSLCRKSFIYEAFAVDLNLLF